MPTSLPPFAILYADPPWQYRGWNGRKDDSPAVARLRGSRRPPYACLSTESLCSLPVPAICASDCALFLWATYPMLPDAFRVLRAWGFRYTTVAFTWVKQTRSGIGYHFGLGFWTRANPEVCLLATRGHPKRVRRDVANLVIAPLREHSQKPDIVREHIVALCGDLPRAELFAREKTPGWACWGDEVLPDFAFPPNRVCG